MRAAGPIPSSSNCQPRLQIITSAKKQRASIMRQNGLVVIRGPAKTETRPNDAANFEFLQRIIGANLEISTLKP